jgi:hypothetical protein
MNRAARRTKSGLYLPGDPGFTFDPEYRGEGDLRHTSSIPKRRVTEAEKVGRAAAREELEHMIALNPPPGFVGDVKAYAREKATEVARRVEQRESGRRP